MLTVLLYFKDIQLQEREKKWIKKCECRVFIDFVLFPFHLIQFVMIKRHDCNKKLAISIVCVIDHFCCSTYSVASLVLGCLGLLILSTAIFS